MCLYVLFSTIRTTLGAGGAVGMGGGEYRRLLEILTKSKKLIINKVKIKIKMTYTVSQLTYPSLFPNDIHDITDNISVYNR